MADLAELIEKVKAATGPDRELDAMVAVSLQIMPSNAFAPSASPDPGTFGTGAYSFWRTPDYTASLDAVVALAEEVLPGWVWGVTGPIGRKADGMMWRPAACKLEGFSRKVRVEHVDPALALLLAILTAKQEASNG